MINIKNGNPLYYPVFAGNISDISTLDDLHHTWKDAGLPEKSPLIPMDRGYPNQEEFVQLDRNSYRFLVPDWSEEFDEARQGLIDQKNCESYDQKTYALLWREKQNCRFLRRASHEHPLLHFQNVRTRNGRQRMICLTGRRLPERPGFARGTAHCLRQTEKISTFFK